MPRSTLYRHLRREGATRRKLGISGLIERFFRTLQEQLEAEVRPANCSPSTT
ncbi:MAG TPA: hypothetical protein VMV69_28970 [Pirellulales bacterium]|nr:hypothetical protein [Pirellulales bacterium]